MPGPKSSPPIELDVDYEHEDDRAVEGGEIRDGRLRVRSDAPESWCGLRFDHRDFKDCLVLAAVSLAEGDDADLFGLAVRQKGINLWWSYLLSPVGRVVIAAMDEHGYRRLADGMLAPSIPFVAGVGAENVMGVLACGPSLTFLLNGTTVTGTLVDPRFDEGGICLHLEHRGRLGGAEATARWMQVRGILPPDDPTA